MKRLFISSFIVLFFVGVFVVIGFPIIKKVSASGECSQYGFMAMYDSYTNSCKCMSGYVFGTDFMGKPYCVSGDSFCREKYGLFSDYNYLDKSCGCSYGYVFGKDILGRTQCVSTDSICRDQLGYNSRYNSIYDKCECAYGYFISGGRCVDGTTQCRSEHGTYSSYNTATSRCECDSGYTLNDSNQCVEKQNNVYFNLKELDTDNKKAIIQSSYDLSYYLIGYGYGCYSSSFSRYLNQKIVLNLGTDFSLDRWDKIVLQNDNEVCDITSVERTDSSASLIKKDTSLYSLIPTTSYLPFSSQGGGFIRTLKYKMTGNDVLQLQAGLVKLGYLPANQGLTTFFGKATQSAVIKFQKDNNIQPPQGLFGPTTQKVFLKKLVES